MTSMAAGVEEAMNEALLIAREDDALIAEAESTLALWIPYEVGPPEAGPCRLENVSALPIEYILREVGLAREGPSVRELLGKNRLETISRQGSKDLAAMFRSSWRRHAPILARTCHFRNDRRLILRKAQLGSPLVRKLVMRFVNFELDQG